jgi:hypothetical protein
VFVCIPSVAIEAIALLKEQLSLIVFREFFYFDDIEMLQAETLPEYHDYIIYRLAAASEKNDAAVVFKMIQYNSRSIASLEHLLPNFQEQNADIVDDKEAR